MPVRARMLGIGGHQSLLHGENEVVRGVEGWRGERRISATEADLQRVDRIAQALRHLDLVIETEPLDVVQQRV